MQEIIPIKGIFSDINDDDWPKNVVVIGAGGFGREVAEICRAIELSSRNIKLLGFLDDNKEIHGTIINDVKVLGGINLYKDMLHKKIHFVVAIGDPKIKENLTLRAILYGYTPITLIHPKANICYPNHIGHGVIIQAGSNIAVNSMIDNHVHINFNCSIGHDVHIGKYSTISPLCAVSGFTDIGEGCFIGSGAITFPSIKIGKWSKLGAGSIATKDLQPYTINIGSSSRIIRRV